jgi:hypothetical protein
MSWRNTCKKHLDNVQGVGEAEVYSAIFYTGALQVGEAGYHVDQDTHSRCFEVARSHLLVGIPFETVHGTHGNGPSLAGARTMRDYITRVLEQEMERVKAWVKEVKNVSGEHDGSCVMHDAMCYLPRGLSKDEMGVVMNLVDLPFFVKPLIGVTFAS